MKTLLFIILGVVIGYATHNMIKPHLDQSVPETTSFTQPVKPIHHVASKPARVHTAPHTVTPPEEPTVAPVTPDSHSDGEHWRDMPTHLVFHLTKV